jgi:hypothetical protein
MMKIVTVALPLDTTAVVVAVFRANFHRAIV